MANYKKEGGAGVKTYSSDPPTAYPSAWEGQLYYNSSDGNFKFQTLGVGAWASGGNMNTARYGLTGAGTQTAGLATGGATPTKALTEIYDGSSWTETGDLNTAREALAGEGTSTATLVHGGNPATGATESFNGSSWTETGD